MKKIPSLTEKIRNPLHQNPVLSVLVLSGAFGFCMGLSNANWQVAVGTGQVLAGIVKYPVYNPNYMYHHKLFTIVTQLSALLLHLLDSERIVSMVISGLIGMVSFQALAMLIFAINRDIYLSALGALFIYFTNYVGIGIRYPIYLLGSPHTYGILGLSFMVLTIALIGAKAYKLGLFCLGLAPCVHPTWGSWLYLIIFFSIPFQWGDTKKVIRTYYGYFIAGMFITVSSLIYQLHLMQTLPTITPEMKNQYLRSFVKYWDYHRRKLYWDDLAQKIRFWQGGIIFCMYSIMVGLLSLIYFKRNSSLTFMFRVIIISGLLSLLLGGLTHFPPEKVPVYLLILMPGRYINLNNIVLAALLLGVLTCLDNKYYKLNYYIFLFFSITPFFAKKPYPYIKIQVLSFSIILLWFVYLTLKRYFYVQETLAGLKKIHLNLSYRKIFLAIMAVYLLINLQNKNFVNKYLLKRSDFKDRTNDVFSLKISERKGMMLTVADFFLISLSTRRPILVDVGALDGLTIAPESGDALNNILIKVYGINILNPPSQKRFFNRGIIVPDLHKELWENRTPEEWQNIREEFEVTDILTPANWKLLLPVIVEDEKRGILYEIPVQTPNDNK